MAYEKQLKKLADELFQWTYSGAYPLPKLAELVGMNYSTLSMARRKSADQMTLKTLLSIARARDIIERRGLGNPTLERRKSRLKTRLRKRRPT